MIAPFFLLFSGSFCCPVGMGKGLFIFPGRLCGCCGLMETDLYGFQGQVFCPVTQLAGVVVAPAPDGAVFFQGEGMVGAGRDFDNVGQYRYRCRPLRSRFSGHRPDAICPDATVIFEDQDGFVAQGDVGDVIDELDFDGYCFGGKFLCWLAGEHGVGASPCPEGAVIGYGEAGVVAGGKFDDEAPFQRREVGFVRVGLFFCRAGCEGSGAVFSPDPEAAVFTLARDSRKLHDAAWIPPYIWRFALWTGTMGK